MCTEVLKSDILARIINAQDCDVKYKGLVALIKFCCHNFQKLLKVIHGNLLTFQQLAQYVQPGFLGEFCILARVLNCTFGSFFDMKFSNIVQ